MEPSVDIIEQSVQ